MSTIASKTITGENSFTDPIQISGWFNVSISGTFVASVTVQRSIDKSTWLDVDAWTEATEQVGVEPEVLWYRVGVNINHNTTYNIETTDVTNGHDFIGCHLYGNAAGSGAIFFDNSKGISIKGGHLDCWIYNYSGASSGYNYVTDMYCPGSYGDVKCLDASSKYPAELIVQQSYGEGAYIAGISINDPGPVYAHARRETGSTQSLVSSVAAQLVFPDVQVNGNRRGAYNASNGDFTVPTDQAGQYRITADLTFSGTAMSATASYVDVKVDGAQARTYFLVPYSTTLLGTTISHDIYLDAGDVVQFIAAITGTSPVFGSTIDTSSFSIERIA